MSDGQIFVLIIVGMSMATGVIISYIETKAKSKKRNFKGDQRLDAIEAKLDKIVSRLEALETIATDEDAELKKKFEKMAG